MDLYKANIRIGGKIKESSVLEIVEALKKDDVEGAEDITVASFISDVEKIQDAFFHSDEAQDGEFPAVTRVLKELGIPYDQHSEAYAEYDPSKEYFRPGIKTETFKTNTSGDPMIEVGVVENIMKKYWEQGGVTLADILKIINPIVALPEVGIVYD